MRISDWSSDVCSSDLSIRQAQADTRRLVAVDALDDQLNIAETHAITDHRVRQMCSQQLRNGLVVIRLRQRKAIAPAQGSDRGVAIEGGADGRGPCRARVWQYGGISGVAGSLKKKQ